MKDLVKFTGEIEESISSSISSISVYDWDEDYITRSILGEIRKTLSIAEFKSKDYRKSITWEMYKLRGSYENKFGDICFVVNLFFKDGTKISGVAFLEAKKRTWRKTTFAAMRSDQAKRMLSVAPRAQYLLYDYEDITNFQTGTALMGEVGEYFRHFNYGPFTAKTNAVCCPLNLAVETKIKDTLLYKHSTPLSLMITGRYFQGLDLEFSKTAKEVATGHLEKFGLPAHIMEVNISDLGVESQGDSLKINQNRYTRIE